MISKHFTPVIQYNFLLMFYDKNHFFETWQIPVKVVQSKTVVRLISLPSTNPVQEIQRPVHRPLPIMQTGVALSIVQSQVVFIRNEE